MKSRIVTPKVGFKNENGQITERVCFPMREVSVSEEGEFWVALSSFADKDKEEQIKLKFDLMVETIASWTEERPFIRAGETDTPLPGENPADAVREYFKDRTVRQERAVNQIINAYSNELAADVVF